MALAEGGCRSNVPLWHKPVALATGQPVRLLGQFGLSLVFCVVSAVQRAIDQFRSSCLSISGPQVRVLLHPP